MMTMIRHNNTTSWNCIENTILSNCMPKSRGFFGGLEPCNPSSNS